MAARTGAGVQKKNLEAQAKIQIRSYLKQ